MRKTDNHIHIEWFGSYRWFGDRDLVFKSEHAHKPGIYLFTVPYKDSQLVYYVGETGKSLAERIIVHTKEYLSGTYRFYDPEKFSKGQKELVWAGTWMKGTKDKLPEFLENYDKYLPLLMEFLSVMCLMLAPLDTDYRTRRWIEGAIARELLSQPDPIGSFQETDIRYWKRKDSEPEIEVTFSSKVNILGLPKRLIV